MALTAASQTLLGQALPKDWLDWLVLLIGIWSGFSVVQVVGTAFVNQNKKRPVNLRLGGYILPVGWIVWGGLFVYGEPGPFSALVSLAGVMAIFIAAKALRR